MKNYSIQKASDFGAASRTDQSLVPAQGVGRRIIIRRIVVSVPDSGTFTFKAGTTQCFPKISVGV